MIVLVLTLPSNNWYVVTRGRQTRVFSTWEACHAQVNGFKGACYKGYKSKDEALVAFSSNDSKLDITKPDCHSTVVMAWKDVVIAVQAVIIFLLICIVFLLCM
jgi:viroplasmin and RNaseH domain-containing protein